MTKFNWVINAMDCIKNEGDLSDVVVVIHWTYVAEKEGFTSSVYGTCSMPLPSGENFTPYEDLTKDQVVGWLVSALDVEEMEENLDKQIDLLINPIIVSLPLPFEN